VAFFEPETQRLALRRGTRDRRLAKRFSNERNIIVISYEVLLGIDRAARDTGRRVTMVVKENDPLSAAIKAEQIADRQLEDPVTMYCHAVSVTPVEAPAALALAA
jgi:hypothetical protein